ncbi:MFS transporter [bacterium]|nr:MFS transporter [bacterium]NBX71919.1 MFS transporter [bacterium]
MPPFLFFPLLFAVRLFGLFAFIPLSKVILQQIGELDLSSLVYLSSSYSFFQAIFQYPLARFSDIYGRLKIIRIGFCIFIIGCLICYCAKSTKILLLGRSLQGAGAIGATAQALLADYAEGIRMQNYYYLIGFAILLSLVSSFLLSPLFMTVFSPKDIFLLSSILALLPLAASFTLKEPQHQKTPAECKLTRMQRADRRKIILFTFLLHCLQMFSFTAYQLNTTIRSPYLYAEMFLYALLVTLYPLAKRSLTLSFKFSLYLSFLGIIVSVFDIVKPTAVVSSFYIFNVLGLLLLLEAALPTTLSALGKQERGGAMGLYSTAQYLGMTLGPLVILIATQYLFIVSAIKSYLVAQSGLFTNITYSTAQHLTKFMQTLPLLKKQEEIHFELLPYCSLVMYLLLACLAYSAIKITRRIDGELKNS